MVEERWEPCSGCVDHCYEAHKLARIPKRRFCFFKVLIGKFDEQLRIPPAFLKHLEHEPSNKLILEGPSRNLWHLTLERTPNSMILHNGWEKFVKDHSLELGDFLVFRYNGGLHFTVQIFDRTACEKEDIFGFGCGEGPNFYKENEEHKEVKEDLVQDFHDPQSKFLETKAQKKDGMGRLSASKRLYSTIKKRATVTRISAGKPTSSKISSQNRGVPGICNYQFGHLVSARRPVSEKERARAFEAANSFKPSKPYFTLVMKPSHVYVGFYLGIPKKFVINNRFHESNTVILSDPSGRRWPVHRLSMGIEKAAFSGGWKHVSLMNCLEEGDACVFELVDDCNFHVHIFRVVDITKPLIHCRLHHTR